MQGEVGDERREAEVKNSIVIFREKIIAKLFLIWFKDRMSDLSFALFSSIMHLFSTFVWWKKKCNSYSFSGGLFYFINVDAIREKFEIVAKWDSSWILFIYEICFFGSAGKKNSKFNHSKVFSIVQTVLVCRCVMKINAGKISIESERNNYKKIQFANCIWALGMFSSVSKKRSQGFSVSLFFRVWKKYTGITRVESEKLFRAHFFHLMFYEIRCAVLVTELFAWGFLIGGRKSRSKSFNELYRTFCYRSLFRFFFLREL
jgi:hypothetical protein